MVTLTGNLERSRRSNDSGDPARQGLALITASPHHTRRAQQPNGRGIVRVTLTNQDRSREPWAVEVPDSARKHGLPDADILHAWRNVLRVAEQDYGGENRIIAVGPARNGALLELVVVPAEEPSRIIHADYARRSFLDRMR